MCCVRKFLTCRYCCYQKFGVEVLTEETVTTNGPRQLHARGLFPILRDSRVYAEQRYRSETSGVEIIWRVYKVLTLRIISL